MENSQFRFERVLLIDNNMKVINILGNYGTEEKAIILLSKKPFLELESSESYD